MIYDYEFEYEFEDFLGLSGIAEVSMRLSGEFLPATPDDPPVGPSLDSVRIKIDSVRLEDLFKSDIADEFEDHVTQYFFDREYETFEEQHNG